MCVFLPPIPVPTFLCNIFITGPGHMHAAVRLHAKSGWWDPSILHKHYRNAINVTVDRGKLTNEVLADCVAK